MISLWELQRELLSDGAIINVSNVLEALTDHVRAEDADNPTLEYLESAMAAYKNDRPDAQPKTRTIEYYRAWDGGQWDTEFIEIPSDTDEDDIALAVQMAANAISWKDDIPVFVGVYHIPNEDETCCRCDLQLDGAGDCPDSTCI